MGDLNSALDAAFDSERAAMDSGAAQPAPEPEPSTPATEGTAVPEAAAQPEAKQDDEPTGDVLLDKLTPDQIAELKKDPRMKAVYRGLMQSYTQRMQGFAEQQRLWEALNNPQTQRQAVEAMARAAGLQLAPDDVPQRQQAAEVADGIAEKWAQVVGPEAAQLLRPLIEETALKAVNGTLQPLQQATEYLQMDARSRQAEAQVSEFRAIAKGKGWNLTPDVESKMAALGQELKPMKAIETVQDGVKHLERLYRLATADTAEQEVEKRIYERMQKAAQTAEPARGVPSTGREKRTAITRDMNLQQALDVGMVEAAAELGWK